MNTDSSLFIGIIHTVFTGDTVDAVDAPGTSLIRVDPSSWIVYYPGGSLLRFTVYPDKIVFPGWCYIF